MRRTVVNISRFGLGCGLGVALLAGAVPAQGQPTMPSVKSQKIASSIVNRSANLRKGDLVLITGGSQDQQLLEDIAVEVRKLGAHPMITIGSDRLTRRLITEVPEQLDSQTPGLSLRMADLVDAMINVDFQEQPGLLSDISPRRLAERGKSEAPVSERLLERGVVQLNLGNGLYPTQALAGQFGMSQEDLTTVFWNGVNADYAKLQSTCEQARSVLAAGREVRITAPNGTDLTVEITERPVQVSNGVITSEQRYAGGPECQAWLPAGEVYVTPVPGTARGTYVADTYYFMGRRIDGLTLMFRHGELLSMTAKSDMGALKAAHKAAPAGRDAFAVIDIGVNPDVQAPRGSGMVSWMEAGTVTVGIGNNTWAGGDNAVAFELYAHLNGATVTVDGRAVIQDGKLVLE
jgi:leucyl aminopeptidase (aminopeptidase T)